MAPQYAQPAPMAPQYAQQIPPQYAAPAPMAPQYAQPVPMAPQYIEQPAPMAPGYDPYGQQQDPYAAYGAAPQPRPQQPRSRFAPTKPQAAQPVNQRYAPKNPRKSTPVNQRYAPKKQPLHVQKYSQYTPLEQPQHVSATSQYAPTPQFEEMEDPALYGAEQQAAAPVVSRFAPVPVAHGKKGKHNTFGSPLRMKRIVWPALALLLPLLYLFFECFAVLEPFFRQETALADLFANLTSGAYDTLPVAEVATITAKTDTAFCLTMTPYGTLRSLLQNGVWSVMPFLIPVAVVALFVAGCLLISILLFATAGRALYFSPFHTLAAFFAAGAVAAPLLGPLVLQLYCLATMGMQGADFIARNITPSPESLLIMCFLFCVMRPAMEELRLLSARANHKEEYPLFPYRSAAKLPFTGLKCIVLFTMLCGMGLWVLYLFLPFSTEGTGLAFAKPFLNRNVLTILREWGVSAWKLLVLIFSEEKVMVDLQDFVELVLPLCMLLITAVLACALIHALISFLRVAFLRKKLPPYSGATKRLFRSLGVRVRNFYMAPFLCYTFFYAVLVCIIMFFTPMVGHVDLSEPRETLDVYYATVFYLKSAGGLTTVYSLIALGGAVLWHSAKQLGLCMLIRSDRTPRLF